MELQTQAHHTSLQHSQRTAAAATVVTNNTYTGSNASSCKEASSPWRSLAILAMLLWQTPPQQHAHTHTLHPLSNYAMVYSSKSRPSHVHTRGDTSFYRFKDGDVGGVFSFGKCCVRQITKPKQPNHGKLAHINKVSM